MKEYLIEKDRAILNQRGFEVFLQTVKAECAVPAHIHSAIELLYINEGTFRIFADDEEYVVGEGDLVLFRSNTIHRVYKLTPKTGYYHVFKVSPELVSDLALEENAVSYLLSLSVNNQGAKKVWRKEECENNGLARILQTVVGCFQKESFGIDIELKLCVGRVMHTILKETKDHFRIESDSENLTRNIYDILIYINKHYSEELNAKECSEMVYLSYSYFSRSFKNIVNMSFKDYLNLTRVNHAEKRLFATDKTITQIASECGFNSVSYFITIYKKIKGKTPQAAREENNRRNHYENRNGI